MGRLGELSKEISSGLSLKSITAYREEDAQFGADQDHSPYRYLETTNDNNHEAFSEELQLNGKNFGDRLDWVAGLFYMHENGSDQFDVVLGGGLFDGLERLPAPLRFRLHPASLARRHLGFSRRARAARATRSTSRSIST